MSDCPRRENSKKSDGPDTLARIVDSLDSMRKILEFAARIADKLAEQALDGSRESHEKLNYEYL